MITTQDDVTKLLPLFRAKKVLQVSWPRMMELARSGTFPVYNISDEPMSLEDLGEDGSGLRVKAADLQEYIDSRRM